MSHCDEKCPCQNPDAPKYPSGKMFKNQKGESLMVVNKTGVFPAARYTVLNVATGKESEHSYPAMVRKETGKTSD